MVKAREPQGIIYGNIFAFWNNLNNDVSIVMWRVAKPTDMIFENHKNQIKSDRLNFTNFFENGGEVRWIGTDTEPNLFFNWNYGPMYYGNSTIGIKQSIERYLKTTNIVAIRTKEINDILRPYIFRSPDLSLLNFEEFTVYNMINPMFISLALLNKKIDGTATESELQSLDFYLKYASIKGRLLKIQMDLVAYLKRIQSKALAKELDKYDPDGNNQWDMFEILLRFNAKKTIEDELIRLNIPLIV